MDVMKLSQKQKITAFIVVLCLGFVALGIFAGHSLKSMSTQYQNSNAITEGVVGIHATQAKLLSLAAGRDDLSSKQIPVVKKELDELLNEVKQDVVFLKGIGLSAQANDLLAATQSFDNSFRPWLNIKSELGFSVDEGKLGELKSLETTIEKKINETGMVTVMSDFQAMIKAQQNYLLKQSENNLKLFNRAMFGFVNTSNSYAMLNLYQKEVEQFKATFKRVAELSQQETIKEQNLLAGEAKASDIIHAISGDIEKLSAKYQAEAAQSGDVTLWSVLIACAVLALVTISIFVMQSVSLTRSLSQTKRVLDKLSQGDLTQKMQVSNNPNDEFNQLAVAINQSCEHLAGLVRKVQENSQALSGDAAALHSGVDKLTQSQTDVMSQSQLLASATEEVSVTTKEVSNSLEFVAEMSKASNQAATEGSTVISAAIESLQDIGEILNSAASHIQQLEQASLKIDSVMDIINGIAEQTNLLALNAAIEAARAGEQGRGFAVVADEVRSLAVRTVDAVADISSTIQTMKTESDEVIQYINQSQQSMEIGQQRGHEAMNAMGMITTKADEAASQTEVIFASMKELATTSQSMADSMVQISAAMSSLEENNTRLSETSQGVDKRSTNLHNDCQRFVV
ncbi:methyl-accepting chemotaxis protein [Vibrio nitrifigilis]|uniref:Methyl-accepting chemotaxis protein n=1 Tax=Vibrio nitrifigilis TaxID=2789781 RepID=A0ABS0GC64_9VIBR|nr:methyl-accepting chemotaxis protein [Vibrio nitrifigilis]MBF8999999.1 methyl-accepting chemotaxis protein [Vibrio nitrifigilis]